MMFKNKQSGRLNDHRAELAELETRLINSLLGLAPAPLEVDPKQVEICSLSLKRKRARTLARMEAGQDTTGGIIKPEMESYFRAYPGPHPLGPHADFRQYQRFLYGGVFRVLIGWIQKRLSGR